MTPAGGITAGGSSVSYTTGTGSGGDVRGPHPVGPGHVRRVPARLHVRGVRRRTWTVDVALPGGRIGMAMHYEQGAIAGPAMGGAPDHRRHRRRLRRGLHVRPPGSGWILPNPWRAAGFDPMFQHDGAMQATTQFQDNRAASTSATGWRPVGVASSTATSSSRSNYPTCRCPGPPAAPTPRPIWSCTPTATGATEHAWLCTSTTTSGVGRPAIRPSTGRLCQYGPNGELIDPDLEDVATADRRRRHRRRVPGTGPVAGRRPTLDGDVRRIYRNGALLGTAVVPEHARWGAGSGSI